MVGKTWRFIVEHPKMSLVASAGVSMVAGAGLLAAALVGGAVTLVLAPRAKRS
jgi:hypothetical protein